MRQQFCDGWLISHLLFGPPKLTQLRGGSAQLGLQVQNLGLGRPLFRHSTLSGLGYLVTMQKGTEAFIGANAAKCSSIAEAGLQQLRSEKTKNDCSKNNVMCDMCLS